MTWPTTKAAGVTFAFIKSSEGSAWVDPRFAENAAGAAAAGILWGPYHYYNNKLDPVAQARHFVATVGRASAPPTLRFALDFEDKTTPPDPAKMERFAVEVEKLTGARPIVYTAAWWWNRARLGRAQPWAARLPLWLADYSPEHIDLPNTGEWQRANVLQFTSSGTGSTYGAESARIDLDTYDGTRDALIAELGYTPPTGIDLARLQREARDNHVIRIFAGSALLQAIHAAGLVPVSNEWEFSPDHQAQVGESFDGTRAAVFVWSRKTNQVTPYPRG